MFQNVEPVLSHCSWLAPGFPISSSPLLLSLILAAPPLVWEKYVFELLWVFRVPLPELTQPPSQQTYF